MKNGTGGQQMSTCDTGYDGGLERWRREEEWREPPKSADAFVIGIVTTVFLTVSITSILLLIL